MIWQLMSDGFVALNGQLRTERDGDAEKGCCKPAVQQKTTDNGDMCIAGAEFFQMDSFLVQQCQIIKWMGVIQRL